MPGGADGAGFAYLPESHTLIVKSHAKTLRLWDLSNPDRPVKGGALHGSTQGTTPSPAVGWPPS